MWHHHFHIIWLLYWNSFIFHCHFGGGDGVQCTTERLHWVGVFSLPPLSHALSNSLTCHKVLMDTPPSVQSELLQLWTPRCSSQRDLEEWPCGTRSHIMSNIWNNRILSILLFKHNILSQKNTDHPSPSLPLPSPPHLSVWWWEDGLGGGCLLVLSVGGLEDGG